MTQKQSAIPKLRRIIERFALKQGLSFPSAAMAVVKLPEYWQLAEAAQGGTFNPNRLTRYRISAWANPKRHAAAMVYDPKAPDPNGKNYRFVAPYLPVRLRQDPYREQKLLVARLRAKGVGYLDCALAAQVSTRTVRRWLRVSL